MKAIWHYTIHRISSRLNWSIWKLKKGVCCWRCWSSTLTSTSGSSEGKRIPWLLRRWRLTLLVPVQFINLIYPFLKHIEQQNWLLLGVASLTTSSPYAHIAEPFLHAAPIFFFADSSLRRHQQSWCWTRTGGRAVRLAGTWIEPSFDSYTSLPSPSITITPKLVFSLSDPASREGGVDTGVYGVDGSKSIEEQRAYVATAISLPMDGEVVRAAAIWDDSATTLSLWVAPATLCERRGSKKEDIAAIRATNEWMDKWIDGWDGQSSGCYIPNTPPCTAAVSTPLLTPY